MKFIFSCSAAFLSHISREKGKKGKFTCMLLIFLPIFWKYEFHAQWILLPESEWFLHWISDIPRFYVLLVSIIKISWSSYRNDKWIIGTQIYQNNTNLFKRLRTVSSMDFIAWIRMISALNIRHSPVLRPPC